MPPAESLERERLHGAIDQLVAALAKAHSSAEDLTVLGIANGGLILSSRIAQGLSRILGREIPHGVVDVSFYRDDIGVRPIPKVFSPTDIPRPVEGGTFILVDDVLHSGRTIRAALEELFALGRPARVELAVLVDRGGRTLPIQPDHVGLHLEVPAGGDVKLRLHSSEPALDQLEIRS